MSSAESCLTDLRTRLQSIAEFTNRVYVAKSPEDLARMMKGTANPFIGVVYEGMTGSPESNNTARGFNATGIFGLYLLVDSVPMTNSDTDTFQALTYLSKMRGGLANQRAPSGNFWQFLFEGYSDSPPNKALWIQRWSTKILVPS